MTIENLNDKYFSLYGDLFSNRSLLTEKQYDVMAKTLLQQYLEELDISLTERILEVGIKNFELHFRSRVYVPRRGFFGYNRIAKRLLKQYKAQFLTELKKLELDVKDEKEVHKELNAQLHPPAGTEKTNLPVPVTTDVAPTEEK